MPASANLSKDGDRVQLQSKSKLIIGDHASLNVGGNLSGTGTVEVKQGGELSASALNSELGGVTVDQGGTLNWKGEMIDGLKSGKLVNKGLVNAIVDPGHDVSSLVDFNSINQENGKVSLGHGLTKEATYTASTLPNNLILNDKVTVDYTGDAAPLSTLELKSGSKLVTKPAAGTLDLGATMANQEGALEVGSGTQTATALPKGGTTIDHMGTLGYTGDTPIEAPVSVGSGGTLTVAPTASGMTFDLGSHVTGEGNLSTVSGTTSASALPTGTVSVGANSTLNYKGEGSLMSTLNVPENATFETDTGSDKSVDLSNKLAGQGGSLVVKSGTTTASALPAASTVKTGSTLKYNGENAPNGTFDVQNGGTLELAPAGHTDLDIGNKLANSAGALKIDNGTVSATDLPTGSTSVAENATLNYKGTGTPAGTITLPENAHFVTDTGENQSVDLGTKLASQAGSLEVKTGNTTAAALPTGDSKVDANAQLNYTGNTLDTNLQVEGTAQFTNADPDLSKVTLGEQGKAILAHANSGEANLGAVKGKGTIALDANQNSSTLPENTKVDVNNSTLDYSGTDGSHLNNVSLKEEGSKLVLSTKLTMPESVDLSQVKGTQGTIELKADQSVSNIGGNKVQVDSGKTMTYTGTASPALDKVTLQDKGSLVLKNTITEPATGLNLDQVQGTGGTITLGANQTAHTLPATGTNTVDVPANTELTYNGDDASTLPSVKLESDGKLVLSGAVGTDSQPVDLSGIQGTGGTIALGANQTASTLPAAGTNTVDVPANQVLTYNGDDASTLPSVKLESDGKLVLSGAVGTDEHPVDLSQVKGTDGTIALGADQTASALATDNTVEVPAGKTLTYTGTEPPAANKLKLDKDGTLAMSPGAGKTVELGAALASQAGNLAVKTGSANATALPEGNTSVDKDAILNYGGTTAPSGELSVDGTANFTDANPDISKVALNDGGTLNLNHPSGDASPLDLAKVKGTGQGTINLGADQTASSLPANDTVNVKDGKNLTFNGDDGSHLNNVSLGNGSKLILKTPIATPADGLDLSGIKGDKGTVELAADQAAQTLPKAGTNTVDVPAGKTLTYAGTDASSLPSVNLQPNGKLLLDGSVGTNEHPVDLSQVNGTGGTIALGTDQTASKLPTQNSVDVPEGKTLTYTGTEAPTKGKLSIEGTLLTNPGPGTNGPDFGDSLAGQSGKLIVSSGHQSATALPNGTTVIKPGATLDYAGTTEPTTPIVVDGVLNVTQIDPGNLDNVTINSGGVLGLAHRNQNPINFGGFGGTGTIQVNADQKASALGQNHAIDITPGNTLTYLGDQADLSTADVTNNGQLLLGQSGHIGDALSNIKGNGAITIGSGVDITVSSLSDQAKALTIDEGGSLNVDNGGTMPVSTQGLRLKGDANLSGAGPVTVAPPQLQPYPWHENSFDFDADRTAMITDNSTVQFDPNKTNKSVGDFVVQGGEVNYGSTLTQGDANRKMFEGLVLANNEAKVNLTVTGRGSNTQDQALIEANFNDFWTHNGKKVDINTGLGFADKLPSAEQPQARAVSTSTTATGQISVSLDNATWITHGFSRLNTLTAKGAVTLDYNNNEQDAHAVAINTLSGKITVYMPIKPAIAERAKSGQLYVAQGSVPSVVSLVIPDHVDHIDELIGNPLRVAVLGKNVDLKLDTKGQLVDINGVSYTYQLKHKAYSEEAIYDTGERTLTVGEANSIFAGDQSYYLYLTDTGVLQSGLSKEMLSGIAMAQEAMYRTGTDLRTLSDRYAVHGQSNSWFAWTDAGYEKTHFNSDDLYKGSFARVGLERDFTSGQVGVLLRFDQGSVSHDLPKDRLKLKQQRLAAGVYAGLANQTGFVGVYAGYERLSQKLENFYLDHQVNALQFSAEAGFNLLGEDRFTVTPEVQLQYTRFLQAHYNGQYKKVLFEGDVLASNSLKVRAGLKFAKGQKVGPVDMQFFTRFNIVSELLGQQDYTGQRNLKMGSYVQYKHRYTETGLQFVVGMSAHLTQNFGVQMKISQELLSPNKMGDYKASGGLYLKF